MKRLFCILVCVGLWGCDDCSCLDNECAPDEDAGSTEVEDAGDDSGIDTCDWNSGQHCACDIPGELCEDEETICTQFDGDEGDVGVCIYYTQTDECPDSPWGEPQLLINMGGGAQCFLDCDEDDDCPPDQECVTEPVDGETLCYP